MELEKFKRQLRLIEMLTMNTSWTVDHILERLDLSKRSFYRYLDCFKSAGFIVDKDGPYYSLNHRSPFFSQITDKTHFTDDEAITIGKLLTKVPDSSPQIRHLRSKLSTLYDFNVLAEHDVDQRIAKNRTALFEAIQTERLAVLCQYSSPHSGQVSDRIVEPYLFLSDNSEVRCYETASGQNKTFKIGRAEEVKVLDMLWSDKDKHLPFYTDLFHFSGESRFPVSLLLGSLSSSLLLEEYPAAERDMEKQEDGRWLLHTYVCSFKGIARFVMGLLDDIELVDSPDFREYLSARIEFLTQKFKK